MTISASGSASAQAVIKVLAGCNWVGVGLAHAFLELKVKDRAAAEALIASQRLGTKAEVKQYLDDLEAGGFEAALGLRTKVGSAENPITKLFPAAITEKHFAQRLSHLTASNPNLSYEDVRGEHTLVDFVIRDKDGSLPINVKNAGTPFRAAKKLVGLEPDDCVPIPAYKAHGALDREPNLVYSVCIDHSIVKATEATIPTLFTPEERLVWQLLGSYTGRNIKKAEDMFVGNVVDNHWAAISAAIPEKPFRAISAIRAISILRDQPKRTPGIGVPAWGTAARGEINVHVSAQGEMQAWEDVEAKLATGGVKSVLAEINRQATRSVSAPLL